MTGVIHVIKLRQIWSKISDRLYPNILDLTGHNFQDTNLIEELRVELEEWRAGAPDEPESTDSSSLSVFESPNWFQIAYNYSILLLYRPVITSVLATLGDPRHSEAINAAFQLCADSARDICQRYRRLYQIRGHIQFTWGSLHILFLAGLTFIYCLWRSSPLRRSIPQSMVINTCMACNTLLVIIAERWSQASSYRDIFESLSERTIHMLSGDHRNSSRADDIGASSTMPVFEPLVPQQSSAGHNTDGLDWLSNERGEGLNENLEPYAPFQEWILGFDCMPSPGDPQWLTQELLNDMGGFPNNPPGNTS